jgi:hypothetical protein
MAALAEYTTQLGGFYGLDERDAPVLKRALTYKKNPLIIKGKQVQIIQVAEITPTFTEIAIGEVGELLQEIVATLASTNLFTGDTASWPAMDVLAALVQYYTVSSLDNTDKAEPVVTSLSLHFSKGISPTVADMNAGTTPGPIMRWIAEGLGAMDGGPTKYHGAYVLPLEDPIRLERNSMPSLYIFGQFVTRLTQSTGEVFAATAANTITGKLKIQLLCTQAEGEAPSLEPDEIVSKLGRL